MALTANETYRGGFIRLLSDGSLAVTTNTAGAVSKNGFLRDPDGRLVVVYV